MEFLRNNTWNQVRAKKEVILSAGSVGTPQLLMLSGVGPKKHLEELKVSTYTTMFTVDSGFILFELKAELYSLGQAKRAI